MVAFNPQTPIADAPNWMGVSKPISPYEGDKSFGATLTGIGNTFKGIVEGADTIIKSVIDNGLRTDLERERDIQTGALEGAVKLPQDQRISPYQTDGNAVLPTLTPGDSEEIPEGLDGLDKAVTGAANGAKAKPQLSSYYNGKLDMIAKDYRSRFPGYADHIDQRVASITGGNPANKRLEELTTMLAQSQGGTQAQTNKALAFMATHTEYPGSKEMTARIANGEGGSNPYAMAIQWAAPHAQLDYLTKQKIQQNSLYTGSEEVRRKMNTQAASEVAEGTSKVLWDQINQGLKDRKDGLNSAQSLDALATDVLSGNKVITDQQGQDYQQAAHVVYTNAVSQIEKRLNTVGPNGEPSLRSTMSSSDYDATIKNATDRYLRIRDAFGNKDYGAGFRTARSLENYTNQGAQYLLSGSPMAEFFQLQSAMKKYGGDVAVGWLTQDLAKGKFGDISKEVQQYKDHNALKLAVNPDETSSTEIIQDLKKRNIGKDPNNPAERSTYTYFSEGMAEKIANPKLDATVRYNLARSVFKGDLAPEFEKDKWDTKGNFTPGKFTVINNMTAPRIRDSIWDLAGSNPQAPVWLNYKNWTARQVNDLSNTAIKDFSTLQSDPSLKFSYNTETNQFKLDALPSFYNRHPLQNSTQGREAADRQLALYQSHVSFVNSAMTPLIGIAKREGRDPNTAVLNQMMSMGLDPRGAGIPSELLRTLVGPEPEKKDEPTAPVDRNAPLYKSSNPASQETLDKVKGFIKGVVPSLPGRNNTPQSSEIVNFAPEDDNSLQSFVSNPDKGASKTKTPVKKSSNLSNDSILGMSVDDIPEGVSARDYIKQLQSRK